MEKLTKASRLRNKIMEAARQLFKTQGYDNTTLEDISKQLQISDIEVLKYFSSEGDLLEAVWSEK